MFSQLNRFFKRSGASPTGAAAETEARRYLESRGYVFLEANHRTRFGEVDLIFAEGETVVFVEVKARGSYAHGRPEEFVRPKKQDKILKAALHYAKAEGLTHRPLRFDVVALGPQGIDHIPNAFAPDPRRYFL